MLLEPAAAPLGIAVREDAWVAGELLCFARNEARAEVGCRVAAGAWAARARLLVVPGAAFVRLAEIEPVHRRARLEVGIQGSFDAARALSVLTLAREAAFVHLNVERLFGWVRPGHVPTREVLALAGFAHEVTVPAALRLGGALVERELWGTLRCDRS